MYFQIETGFHKDADEGIDAFLEKRDPIWFGE